MKSHSSKKNKLGVISCLLLFSFTAAHAVVNVSVNIVPILESGTDPHGVASSTWTMSFDLPELYNNDLLVGTAATEGTLHISGSVDLDAIYTITSSEAFPLFIFVPNVNSGGLLFFGLDGDFTLNAFDFAGVNVSNFGARGSSVVPTQPLALSPILASHWDGALLNNTVSGWGPFTVSDGLGSGEFSFSNALLTATVVPEPSHVAFLIGSICLFGLVTYRRRKQCPDIQ